MALMAATHALLDVAPTTASLGATTSTSALALGENTYHLVVAGGDMHIKCGLSSLTAAAATDFKIPSGTIFPLFMGKNTHVRLYNPGGSPATYWIQAGVRC